MSSPLPLKSRLPAESEAPTSYSWLRETRPSSISEALAVSAHVERDHVPVSEPLGQSDRGDDTGGGARLEREDGLAMASSAVITPPGLHDHQRSPRSEVFETAPDVTDVAGHQGPDIGVDNGGRGALVLLLLSQDLARQRDRDPRQLITENLAQSLLVLRMQVCMQEANRDASTFACAQTGRHPSRVASSSASRTVPSAAMRSAISKRRWRGTSEGASSRSSRRDGHAHPTQLEHVAKPCCRHDRRPRRDAPAPRSSRRSFRARPR